MLYGSFLYGSFCLSNVVLTTSWTEDLVYDIGLHECGDFVFGGGEVCQLRCFEKGIDLDLFLWI